MLFWAFARGKAGHAKLYDDSALDVGSCVHMMCELDLKGRAQEDIDFYLETTLRDPEDRAKASSAFTAFRKWRADFHVTAHTQETSFISERLQYGGTIDTAAIIRNGLALIDFKTTKSGEVYPEMVLQLAAYSILWEENRPDEPLTAGYHLILLPKDGSKPIHREFTEEQMHPFKQLFWCYRKAFDLDVACSRPDVLQGITVKPSKPTKPKAARKPAAVPPRPASMAEILRSYGHLSQGAEVRA